MSSDSTLGNEPEQDSQNVVSDQFYFFNNGFRLLLAFANVLVNFPG